MSESGNTSVNDLTKHSLNESISSNNQDKQIVPYVGNKTDCNDNTGGLPSKISDGKDNSIITPEQPNEIVHIVQRKIGNSNSIKKYLCNLLEKFFLKQPFNVSKISDIQFI